MGDASREGNADPSTQTKPEGAMTPPGTPTEWRALQKTTEANKPSVNDTKPKRTDQQGGSCKCPSKTGTPMCSAKTQGRTCHCQVEGRTRPSKIPSWIDWCTCDNWKASMLTEAGPRDTNCRCPAGGRPRPRAILPEVTWCSCGTGGQLDERTNTRDFPKTPEKNTKDSEVTAEGGEEKNLSNKHRGRNQRTRREAQRRGYQKPGHQLQGKDRQTGENPRAGNQDDHQRHQGAHTQEGGRVDRDTGRNLRPANMRPTPML